MNNDFSIAKTVLEQNGKLTGITAGHSMRPLFRDNRDKAVIVPLTRTPKVNDVLLYKKSTTNNVVLHRVVKIKDGKPILRGDGLFFTECNLSQEHIVGIMEGFYRNGKYHNCQKSVGYRIYVFWLHTSYPMRRLFHKIASFFKVLKRKIKKSV